LYVADSGNGRVQVLRLPSLELRTFWEGSLQEPTALAADSQGRLYVLDSKVNTVLRFSQWGEPDDVYNTMMKQNLGRHTPFAIAIDDKDTLYVSLYILDTQSDQLLLFDDEGIIKLDAIQGKKPKQPCAMAAHHNVLYIADDDRGEIWILDCIAGIFPGTLPDYRGPVTAMAVDESGTLYIKPGLDETYHTLNANLACVPFGTLTAGPFDAGIDIEWERVHAEVNLPDDTDATLHIFTASDDQAEPDWSKPETLAASLDTLVTSVKAIAPLSPKGRRFLWLQVELHSDTHRRTSPRLWQVQAATTAESYLTYLPAVYRRRGMRRTIFLNAGWFCSAQNWVIGSSSLKLCQAVLIH
jgi:hypothetical protein